MKKTYTRILSIALTIALLSSLILGILPVSAMSQPQVVLTAATPSDTAYQISSNNIYQITYTSGIYTAANGTIVVTFPTGTSISSTIVVGDVNVICTAGVDDSLIATAAFNASPASITRTSGTSLTITLGPTQQIGINSIVRVTIGTATHAVANPGTAGSLSLTVTTSRAVPSTVTETATSAAYVIKAVTIGAVPGIVTAYNSSNQIVYQFNSADSIQEAIMTGGAVKIVVGPGTYEITQDIVPLAMQTVVSSDGKATTFILLSDAFNVKLTATGVTFDGFTVSNTTAFVGTENILINKTAASTSTIKVQNCTIGTITAAMGINVAATNNAPVSIATCTLTTTGHVAGIVTHAVQVNASNTANSVNIKTVTFTIDTDDAALEINNTVAGMVVESCAFTGTASTGYGIAVYGAGITIKTSTFNTLLYGVYVGSGTANVTIGDGNTFAACGTAIAGGAVVVPTAGTGATVAINNNTFSGNVGYSISITSAGPTMNVTGNTFTGNGATKGVLASGGLLNAVMNWWGAAAGPNTTGAEKVTTVVAAGVGTVTVDPWVRAATTTSSSCLGNPPPAVTVFDASATAGIKATFVDGNVLGGTRIIGSKYGGNPTSVAPPGTAVLAYYDVYTNAIIPNTITLQFYATGISPATNVYYWNALLNKWVRCDTIAVSGNGLYVVVTLNAAPFTLLNPMTVPNTGDLGGTVFAVVTGIAPAPPSFNVVSPAIGSNTLLTNIPFAWAPVTGATSYTFVLSKNADMSSPVVTQNTTATAYTYTGTLTAGPYYWQVSASEGSKSVTGTFIAAAPPATTATITSTIPGVTTTIAPTTTIQTSVVITTVTTNVTNTTTTQPIVISTLPAPTYTFTTITQPAASITFTNPPATTITTQKVEFTSITPAWIYVIIGIGAVLIIVVIVLVVRTRRTV
jgi:hypothetical protein